MNLDEIKDPELLKLFAEYEKEFESMNVNSQHKTLKNALKPKRILRPAKNKKIRSFDGHLRSLIWEYR